mgnify:CR=1 FL=1
MATTKPKFKHDCAACTFLGRLTVGGETADLYHCPGSKSVVARMSSDGPDYSSMPDFMEDTGNVYVRTARLLYRASQGH